MIEADISFRQGITIRNRARLYRRSKHNPDSEIEWPQKINPCHYPTTLQNWLIIKR